MACTYLQLTISSVDIAAATSNSNVYPYLDNTVFVDYYDCYGNVVTEPFVAGGVYTASACTDTITYGLPSIYYYVSDVQTIAVNSSFSELGNCIPSTPTPTPTITTTPTPSAPGCYYIGKFYYSAIDCYDACDSVVQLDVYSTYDPPIVGLSIFYTDVSPCTNILPDGYYNLASTSGPSPLGCYTISGGSGLLVSYSPCMTPTPTPTNTETPTNTPTNTETPTNTPTNTETPTNTPTPTNTETPTNTPTPTNTETPTQTPTPTNTETPTQTPTPTNTETPTQTPTMTPTSGYIVQFQSCTNSLDTFRFIDLPSTFIIGETYLITDTIINGCATVISYDGSGPIYDGTGVIFTEVAAGCGDILCPIISIVPALLSNCGNGEIIYATVQQDTAFVGATYYYNGECYSFIEFSGPGGPNLGEPDFSDCIYCVPSQTPTPTPQPTPTITPTPSATPVPCGNNVYCFNTTLSSLTGYTGNYTLTGSYNSKPYYSGDSITTSFIYYTGVYWCLSDSLGGTCLLQGATPCYSNCPDISATDFTVGPCPSPTPLPIDCTTFDFNAYFDCDWEPIPTPTPSVPCDDVDFDMNSFAVSPTPTPYIDPCLGVGLSFSLSGYTPVVPTVTLTPSVTLTNTVPAGGQVTFNMLTDTFSCVSVKVLTICETGVEIYTTDSLVYFGLPITTGTTMLALVNEKQTCVTYVRDDFNFSSNSNVIEIYQVYGNCSSCSVLPTPTATTTNTTTPTTTPTSTMTQTPTNTGTPANTPTQTSTPGGTPPPTPTPTSTTTPTNTSTPTQTKTGTPTPTPTPHWVYVYESCTPISPNVYKNQVLQNVQSPIAIVVGQTFRDINQNCWKYLGKFMTNYIAPINTLVITSNVDYFDDSYLCVYSDCSTCLNSDVTPKCTSVNFPVGVTSTSITVGTAVSINSCEDYYPLTVRRIYYSPTNNPPLFSDPYFSQPLLYGYISSVVTGLNPNTGYYFSLYSENSAGDCSNSYSSKVYTTS